MKKFSLLSLAFLIAIQIASIQTLAAQKLLPKYKVDKTFDMKSKDSVLYMAVNSKDQLCVLYSNGAVNIIMDNEGKKIASFKPEINGRPCCLAVDKDNLIYVVWTKFERNKNRSDDAFARYFVYSSDGTLKRTCRLPAVLNPVAAQFVGEKLVLADNAQSSLFVFNTDKGEPIARINKGIRICCGIFDFCPGPDKNSIMVANLGAFKVSSFSLDGTLIKEFGSRGKDLNQFQGCCNPVSVSCIPGGILTVEKSPTRVKIFDKEGRNAVSIEGVDDLVQGCIHIPLACDSKGNIYLASETNKNIIRCVPDKRTTKE